MPGANQLTEFRKRLLAWFGTQQRDLPWRRTRDPYRIWVSEIMLQQTRVAAAIPYFERFVERFPDVAALAAATEADLLAAWAGLGYYHRARNLQKAARLIQVAGGFPASYQEIRQLPGVGDYTAAAVASIAFDLPHTAVDGNVLRVASRVFDDPMNVASTAGRKHFAVLAAKLLDRARPGAFNQAMMELGATLCSPKNPRCLLCPVAEFCDARANGSQNALPVKLGNTQNVEEERAVFWIEDDDRLLVWQRPAESRLMPGFWELPEAVHLPMVAPGRKLGSFRHSITFHSYQFEVREAAAPQTTAGCRWMTRGDLERAPLSTIFKKAKRLVDDPQAK
ncbi:MAG TPA: A/G-specific adenine glycosylase [Bryobacteraceae bacterium]|jgi:A/G-specific adenine glycosylase